MDYENPTFRVPPQSLSIWEKFNPRHLWLADKVAQKSREKNDLGALMANAKMGIGVDDQERMEKEGRLKELTMQFVEQTKDLDESAYNKASEQFMNEVGSQVPQRQAAELRQPNLAQSGFGLLAAILDPRHAADNVAQTFGFQINDQKQRQEQLDQNFADQTRNRNEKIGAAETRMNLEERKLGRAQSSQDRQANMTRMLMQDVQGSLDKMDQRESQALSQAYSQYSQANRADEKAIAGKRLQTLLSQSSDEKMRALAPTDEEIAGAAEGLRAEGTRYAAQEWENALRNELNAFGEVDESRAGQMETQRLTIAQRYGIDPKNLRVTPTGKTIAGEKLALANQQFAFLKTKTAQDFKLKWANYQVAKQRAATYAQAVANGLALGTVRNQISAGNLQMRGLEFSFKDMAKGSMAEIKSLQNEIKTLAGQTPSDEVNKKLDAKRSEMRVLLENLSGEFGIDPSQWLQDPVGTMETLLRDIEGQQQETQKEAKQASGLTGPIGKAGAVYAKPTGKPRRKDAFKPTKVNLPPGWKQ